LPLPNNPQKRDFFVYQFRIDGYPFYVGIGRDKRATDRLRYVRSLMGAKSAIKLGQKSLSVRVMAALLRRDITITLSCTRRPMNRQEALIVERKTIKRFVTAGFQLTNWQHNPYRHNNTAKAVRVILSSKRG
jgi:hypothetical protein